MLPTLIRVPPQLLFVYWPEVEKLLAEHPETWDRGQTKESIQQLLMNEKLHLWALCDSEQNILLMAFTEFRNFPTGRILACVWMEGKDLRDNVELVMSAMEQFAWECGASYTIIEGRPGWQKVFAPYGYEFLTTSIIKSLSKNRTH